MIALFFAVPWFVFRDQMQSMVKWGYWGLFLSCLLTNMTILLPVGSTIHIVMASTLLNPWLCILVGSMGAALGEQSAYLWGKLQSPEKALDRSSTASRWLHWFGQKSRIKVFAAAAVPLPLFDIVAIQVGAIRMPWIQYTITALCGKIVKYAMAVACFQYILPLIAAAVTEPYRSIIESVLSTFTITSMK